MYGIYGRGATGIREKSFSSFSTSEKFKFIDETHVIGVNVGIYFDEGSIWVL